MSEKIGAPKKGLIKNLKTKGVWRFKFNPETYEYSIEANFDEIAGPGMPMPVLQYTGGGTQEFPLEFFLYDRLGKNRTIMKTDKFFRKLMPPPRNNKRYKKPPEVLISYGKFVRKAVLKSYKLKVTQMNKNLVPIEATITTTWKRIAEG